jgi:hypothetical protein
MKQCLTLALFLGLSGLGVQLCAQPQAKAGEPSSAQQPPQQQQQQQTGADSRQPAQTFQGRIAKAGNQLVFQDPSTQTAYQLDDQNKVAPYEGKTVKLMATVDPKTNTLHVVDIAPAEK